MEHRISSCFRGVAPQSLVRFGILGLFLVWFGLTSGAQPVPDPVPPEMLRNCSPTNTLYVDQSGNDNSAAIGDPARPWNTPYVAVQTANAAYAHGRTDLAIKIGPGTFNLGAIPLWPTNGIIIAGTGSNFTALVYYGQEHSNGPAIMFSDGQIIRDMAITCLQPPNEILDQTCVGALSDSPNQNYWGTNYIYNCVLDAGAHGIQLNPTNGRPARVMCWNCTFSSPNAPAQVLVPYGTIELHNFYADAIGPEPEGRPFSCGFENFAGTLLLKNGTIRVRADYNGAYALGITSGNLPGSSINGPVFNSVDNVVFDVESIDVNPEMIFDVGVEDYDPSPLTILNNCSHIDGSPVTVNTKGEAAVNVTYSLVVSRTPSEVGLSWPRSATGYHLEQASAIGGTWSRAPMTPVTNGLWLGVNLPAASGMKLFRLHNP